MHVGIRARVGVGVGVVVGVLGRVHCRVMMWVRGTSGGGVSGRVEVKVRVSQQQCLVNCVDGFEAG